MAQNQGKKFEQVIKESFDKVKDVSVDRIPDQVTKFKGSSQNICDFVVYKYPNVFYLECKSVHGNTLSISSIPKADKNGELHGFYGNIRDNQWEGLLKKSHIPGVVAGVICWWVDKDVTKFIPIAELQHLYDIGFKSIRYDTPNGHMIDLVGQKKRVFFDYDMEQFLKHFKHFKKGD